ncbi:MAG: DUF4038 domain-containing protein [Acidobacteria bacterium]|nr:DUF4038 domain-containing protein [Acidobacteriota bacterium]
MRLSRRTFLAGMGALSGPSAVRAQSLQATVHCATEWAFTSAKSYGNPFADVELDVIVRDPDGAESRVPAFWAGSQTWRVRYSPAKPGMHTWRTVSSDAANSALDGQSGTLQAAPYNGANPLYRHGPLRVAKDGRHFAHADGTPFFWLGDTWWMGLVKRLRWPEDFQLLAADRCRKGFTVVQIVAGLYPDMPDRDPRGANEAGFPYDEAYAQVNPAYFDMADLRIRHLAESGIAPCVVGCWGYYLPILGIEKMKRHWRYLVARWGACPVVWCLAGEGSMPYYLSKNREGDAKAQRTGWTELGRYLRSIDPYRHMITIHPSTSARATVDDPSVLDFDMLQTGHSDRESIPNTLKLVTASYQATPVMPVINGEVCYEGIQEASRQEVQRFMFWACLLSGAAGHTYGANGIWQVNTPEQPFGASPHGRSWGETPWQTAYQLPGSGQLGMAKSLLAKYSWWRMAPHPEWIEPHWAAENYMQPYAAGIPGELRVFYFPRTGRVNHKVKGLETGLRYRAFWWNAASGKVTELGTVSGSAGEWQPPPPLIFQDYVLVIERA